MDAVGVVVNVLRKLCIFVSVPKVSCSRLVEGRSDLGVSRFPSMAARSDWRRFNHGEVRDKSW